MKKETEDLETETAYQNGYEAGRKAAKQETAGWVPVTERLPADNTAVLTVVTDKLDNIHLEGAYELATFSIDEGWILEMWPGWEGPNVTHWMPLPEPPDADPAGRGYAEDCGEGAALG